MTSSYTTEDASQWNYKRLRVVVTHLGAVDSSGMTVKLSSSSEAIFNYKLKLSQLPSGQYQLVINIHILYNVLFNKLIDTEEIVAVDYYEVHARTKVNVVKYMRLLKIQSQIIVCIVLEFVDKDGNIIEVPEGNEIEFYVEMRLQKDDQRYLLIH